MSPVPDKPDAGRTAREKVLNLARSRDLIRPRDIDSLGVHRMVLTRLTEEGLLSRIGRGVYRLSDAPPLGAPDLVLVAARVPNAVIGLVTALEFHGLTSEIPRAVDILLPRKARKPTMADPPLRVFSGAEALIQEGVMETEVDGVPIRLSTPEKAIADCFKYRSRVGLDVAIEALRKALTTRTFRPATFAKHAKSNRVLSLVRPYLESMS